MQTVAQTTYRIPSFVQIVRRGDRAIIWHSLFGNPRVVSESALEFLSLFNEPISLADFADEYEVSEEASKIIDDFIGTHYLIPDGFDERAFLAEKMQAGESAVTDGSRVDYLELIMSEACNFRCVYCIHFDNLETSERINAPKKHMTFDVAKKTVDGFIEALRQHGKKTAEINFGGGEPLLVWPVVRQVLSYCVETYSDEFVFSFSINTNGSLITREIAESLRDYRVSVAISLDGLGDANDSVRIKRSGLGTFVEITRGIDWLAEVGYPIDGVAVTVNELNFSGVNRELIDWAHDRNMTDVRIDIDVINMVHVPVEEIVERLVAIRRYAKSLGIDIVGFWSRAFENLNSDVFEDAVAFCGAVRGNSMCVSPSGGIYGCGYSTAQLGSLAQIKYLTQPEGDYHRFVKHRFTGAMEMCRGCMIEAQCGGGCNITQEYARATRSAKMDRMCDFYRAMTRELVLEQLESLA